MVSQTITLTNKIGIHSRPASMIVNEGAKYQSSIVFMHGERKASAKSLIGLLSLKAKYGSELTVSAEGADEAEALRAVVDLIETQFGEE